MNEDILHRLVHLAPLTWVDWLSAIAVLGSAAVILILCVQAWWPRRPRKDPSCLRDWQTPTRQLRLATINCPAPKGFLKAPARTSSACGDAGRRPATVPVEDGSHVDHRATVLPMVTRKGPVH